ncbi:MAG: glycosyltransferase [Bacteroidetes bacterium]|nr:glycosyltransferase [Bacteroidota bacterium]
MLIELYIFAFIIVAYGTFTTLAVIGFNRLNRAIKPTPFADTPFISIVISARNEADTIELCLRQIIKQEFPKTGFEVILVDDDSKDSTYDIAFQTLKDSGLSYQLIQQTEHHGKKQNLALAIQKSRGSVIITSDADIVYRSVNWLSTISDYFKVYAPNLLIMPIDFESRSGFLETFQIVENIALTGITAGYSGLQKPFMCNGANLAFKKTAYEHVNGYESHLHITSGEDVFLLEDLKKLNPAAIHYGAMRDLIIKTRSQTTFKSLFNQRVRWAYKAKYNTNKLNLFAGFIVMAANILFLALLVAILKKSVIIPYLSIFALAKCVFDFLLLFLASDFLGRAKFIVWLIPFECVYWLYAFLVGTASLFFKPYWKEKKIN